MASHLPFRLNRRSLMVALISAAFSGEAGAVAGRVDFTIGGTTVSGADGQRRPLAKGAELDKGDTVRTDAEGRAQIRFSDGSYVSLQPNTEFAIKDYNYEGKTDGSERGFFGLARGAMRTVTGFIGRVNRNRYQISTPTATVGIRGTGGQIEVLLDGSTVVSGTSGIWTLSNPAGTLDIPAGVSGKAPAAPNQPPQQTSQGPSTGPAQPPPPPVFTSGDQRDATGGPAALASISPPLVSGSGFALSAPLDGTCGGDCGPSGFNIITSSVPVDGVFDASGRLTQFTVTDPNFGSTTYTLDVLNGGMHGTKPDGTEDFGTRDGVIAWGRWIGPVIVGTSFTLTSTFAADQGLHYVVGTPTPIASLPTTAFTYDLIGATAPTYANGGVAPGRVTAATLMGDFAKGTVGVTLSALDGNGLGYNGSASGPMNRGVPGALFATSGTGSGAACPNGCGFNANGFFAGNTATHAGISYSFSNTGVQGGDLIGVAAFKR